jgi:iron complex outermembrane receptor protein
MFGGAKTRKEEGIMTIRRAIPMATTAALLLGGVGANEARAQPAAAEAAVDEERPGDAEIIVTAQRREERLSDVPVSVTAVSGADLERRQIETVRDLFGNVPNLAFQAAPGDRNDLLLTLRGNFTPNDAINVDPAVGVYLNEVYLGRTQGLGAAFVDLERVEVLRGPQGTLFGRNTIGGAMNIVTRRPTDQFEGFGRFEVGNYDLLHGTLAVNVPLGKGVAARLVYDHSQHSGYDRSLFLRSDQSDQNTEYLRATIKLTPTDKSEIILYGDYFTSRNHSPAEKLIYFAPGGLGNSIPSMSGDSLANYLDSDWHRNHSNYNPIFTHEIYDLSMMGKLELGFAEFKSITAYRNIHALQGNDYDGTPYSIFTVFNNGHVGEQFSQEFQLTGSGLDDRLGWVGGIYLFREEGSNPVETGSLFPVNPFINSNKIVKGVNKSESIFGQLTFAIIPSLSVTAGARYVEEKRSVQSTSIRTNTVTGAVTCTLPALLPDQQACIHSPPAAKYDYIPWTVGLEYEPNDDILFYGKVSTGFRSGGFPAPGSANPAQYDPFGPEKLRSYEVGAKLSLADRRLFLGVAGYRSDYSDVQVATSTIVGGANVNLIRNTGKARIWGLEAESSLNLGALKLNAALGWTDPKFTRGPLVGAGWQVTSKITAAANADYRIDMGLGQLNLHADYAYRSRMIFYFVTGYTQEQLDATSQDGYGLLNGRISFTPNSMRNLEFSLWAKNVTDEEYVLRTANFSRSLGYNVALPGDPRTFGAAINYKF